VTSKTATAEQRQASDPDGIVVIMTEAVKGPASYFPSIEKKYGRPIAEWQELIRASPLTKHMELVGWLKAEYGMGHGHANALVGYTLAQDRDQQR
jgi:hypothetical protein